MFVTVSCLMIAAKQPNITFEKKNDVKIKEENIVNSNNVGLTDVIEGLNVLGLRCHCRKIFARDVCHAISVIKLALSD